MNKFPIGFWNYTKTGEFGVETVKDWEDLGVTVTMSPEYNAGYSCKHHMLEMLDECAARDIKMIICDSRATSISEALNDPKRYENRFKQAYHDFGHHPATYGFFVSDEPGTKEAFEKCEAANRIQLSVAPELTPFLNLNPYWEGVEKFILGYDTMAEWGAHMGKDVGLKLISYDHYYQMNPGEEGVHGYFMNLRKYGEAAKAAGIPLWTTLLSVPHFRYRQPSEDDFRWQLNTAVACGCKGILWFFLYMREPTANYRLSPIDEFGNRTEAFDRLSRVNRVFQHHVGEFFASAENTGVYMIGKAYGGYPMFDGSVDRRILDVTCDHGLPGIVSFFKKDGEDYVCMVNNSPFESGMFKVHFSKDIKSVHRLKWSGLSDIKYDHWDAFYREEENEIVCGDWCAPGQMQVYKFC